MFLGNGDIPHFVVTNARFAQHAHTHPVCDSKMRNVPISPDRLDAIEEKLAHLEHAVNELSDVVARQQKELDRAQERNQRLLDKIAAMESDGGASATAVEKPPHY
jgi:SlyX protein